MSLDVTTLRESFERIAESEPDLAYSFYETLFSRYPQVRPLFQSRDLESQAKMLSEALVAVVDHLEDAPWLTTTLSKMGAEHADLGVTPEMYAWVSECMLATFEDVAGAEWSQVVADAWFDALSAVSNMMIEGASSSAALES